MKEKQIKMNLIVNSVTIVLLATILFICTAFAWYVTNKTVSANGIGGASAVGNLHVTTHNIYKAELENGQVKPPTEMGGSESNQGIGTTGLLSGDVVYYGVTLSSDNNVIKDLPVQIVGIDGGQWLTLNAIEITQAEYKTYHTSGMISAEDPDGGVWAAGSVGTYLYYLPLYKFENNVNVIKEYVPVTVPTYEDANGEFYVKEIEGVYNKYYIYEGTNGRLNMMDVYTIGLSAVHLIEEDENGTDNILMYLKALNDGDTNTGDNQLPLNNLVTAGNLTSNDLTVFDFVHDKNVNKIDSLDLIKYKNWDPTEHHSISLIFEIKFDTSKLENLGISMNSLSRNELSFDGMVIIGEDKGATS